MRHHSFLGVTRVCIVAALLLTSCDTSNMQFVQDHRVRIVEPADRSTVTLPLNLRWEVNGFEITGKNGTASRDAGYFAIFFDRPPMPPGKSLEWMARQEGSCGSDACGSVKNLADVYATESTTLKVTLLPAIDESSGVERHEAVVVLLDGSGNRIGESAFYVTFNFKRTV